MISLSKPILDEEMKEAAVHALQNERFVGGESVFKFEEEFAQYCGTDYAISTASGTAALTLSLIALGVRQGEVVTTPASFVASANSIIHAGGTPRFADITYESYTMDPNEVTSSLSERTKALMPVHLYGYPASMDEICDISSSNHLALIEDACQAHGATYRDRKVGSIGHVGCFSFYPSKNMTVAGDGGIVVTNDKAIAESVTSLKDSGRLKGTKYAHVRLGFTERLSSVLASIGRVQLRMLDGWNERRRQIARKYDELLSDLGDVVVPPGGNSITVPVYHMYVIRCRRRDDLAKWLSEKGVETGIHYPEPIHLQPVYRELFGYVNGQFPKSESLCRDALSIPMHPSLSFDEVEFVSRSIHKFYNHGERVP